MFTGLSFQALAQGQAVATADGIDGEVGVWRKPESRDLVLKYTGPR